MPYSKKKTIQVLTESLIQFGIEDIVISPGSRNGAMIMHFAEHPKIKTYSIVDERAAGFFALGMAKKMQKPVAVCCTSGSATVNYYPAVVEAFYQNIPLIILSADRPEELIDQFDGQTIRQNGVFMKHLSQNIQLKESLDSEIANAKQLQKAIQSGIQNSEPIHINIPTSEPIYENCDNYDLALPKIVKKENTFCAIPWVELKQIWNNSHRVLVLVGLQNPNKQIQECINQLAKLKSVVILTESTSNLNGENLFQHIDRQIFNFGETEIQEYKPDLLITLGQNVISKKVKTFLRHSQPKFHWHINQNWQPDTYFSLSHKIKIQAHEFLNQADFLYQKNQPTEYFQMWNLLKEKKEISHQNYLESIGFSDLKVFEFLSHSLPKNTAIHFSNSSIIRYAQLFNFTQENYCNRGASGIDGSTGTAIGFAQKSKAPVVLITGDISFFYDSNSLWNESIPHNFKIILLNNGGGNIFKIIPGPKKTNAIQFFEAPHNLSAKQLCEMFQICYQKVDSLKALQNNWSQFIQNEKKPSLLEIDTRNQKNEAILKAYFALI